MSAFGCKVDISRSLERPLQAGELSRYDEQGLGGGAEMKRREFVTLIGGAAAWPLAARAQQNERIKRIGVLQPFTKNSPESARVAAFVQELERLGWTDGYNLQIEYRWEANDLRKAAMELVAFSPDVILVSSTPAVNSVQQATRTIPVVFTQVADPISAGIVASLAKPGGNTTGLPRNGSNCSRRLRLT